MHYDKKQLEIMIMEYFRQNNAGFPKARVTPSESPDFIVSLSNKNNIGIELTRLHRVGSFSKNENHSLETGINNDIVSLACDIFSALSPLKLFVKVLFSSKNNFFDEQKTETAELCAKIVFEEIRQKNQLSFFSCTISQKVLPAGIERILIIHHPILQTHVWERANNLGASANVVEDINQSIFKKDEKLRIYHKKKLNLYWLLITTDRLRGMKSFDLSGQIERQKFHSLFQKVFLFDLMKPEIYQIV